MFYDQIKEICDRKGIKITSLINSVGLSKGNIRNWKSGVNPKYETKVKIANYLNIPIEELLTPEEKLNREEISKSIATITEFVTKDLNTPIIDKSSILYAAYEALEDESEEFQQDILDYIKFKKSQKKD